MTSYWTMRPITSIAMSATVLTKSTRRGSYWSACELSFVPMYVVSMTICWCVIFRDDSILFREYVKRLESHDCCQKLQLQSFLLLPMQRITRMPLLILNILNRITLQHKDRKIVEDALRIIQSVSSGNYLK